MLIPNLRAALAQEPPRMLALRIRVLAPRWFQDVPESSFSDFLGISHQAAPGSSQKFHFEHFWALAAKWPQEGLRRFILSIFVPWPPNAPRRLPEDTF